MEELINLSKEIAEDKRVSDSNDNQDIKLLTSLFDFIDKKENLEKEDDSYYYVIPEKLLTFLKKETLKKETSQNKLTALIKKFGIHSDPKKLNGLSKRVYYVDRIEFMDNIKRYCPHLLNKDCNL